MREPHAGSTTTAWWFAGVGVGAASLAFASTMTREPPLFDFGIYWQAGVYALHGQSPYSDAFRSLHIEWTYSPFGEILMMPFGLISARGAWILWTALNLVAIGVIVWLSFAHDGMAGARRARDRVRPLASPARGSTRRCAGCRRPRGTHHPARVSALVGPPRRLADPRAGGAGG